MKAVLAAVSTAGLLGCASQIFLDGPVEEGAAERELRIVHISPVPTPCPEVGMANCYLVTDGEGGPQRLLEAPFGVMPYAPGTDYVVEITEQRITANGASEVRWTANRVVDRHPRAR